MVITTWIVSSNIRNTLRAPRYYYHTITIICRIFKHKCRSPPRVSIRTSLLKFYINYIAGQVISTRSRLRKYIWSWRDIKQQPSNVKWLEIILLKSNPRKRKCSSLLIHAMQEMYPSHHIQWNSITCCRWSLPLMSMPTSVGHWGNILTMSMSHSWNMRNAKAYIL